MVVKAIIVHGNGDSKCTDHWIPYVKEQLASLGIQALAPQFPDTELARKSIWVPYIKNELQADEETIIIGHSSGAILAMYLAQKMELLGSVLVGTYHTTLGMESEQASGYFDTLWDWEAMKKNQQWIIQFASTDDPWIPIEEARYVHQMLGTEYYEFHDQGHLGTDVNKQTFPELVEAVKKHLENSCIL